MPFIQKATECLSRLIFPIRRLLGLHPKLKLDVYAATDCGKVRPSNEDSYFVAKSTSFYAVCDGMGGTSAGDVASAMMVEALERHFQDETASDDAWDETSVVRAARHVNRKIRQYIEEHNLTAMGTTLVSLRINSNQPSLGVVFNAGDSRVYRIRDKKLEQLTNDHSYARKTNLDEQLLTPRQRNMLTNAIGIGKKCYLERSDVDIRSGDLFILCSDGLYKSIGNDEILRTCNEFASRAAEELCRELIELALDAGGKDNITVVIVKVFDTGGAPTAMQAKSEQLKESEHIEIGWQNQLNMHTA